MTEEIFLARSVSPGGPLQKAGDPAKSHKITASSPVAMFDSGVGGLTVLKEVIRQMPLEEVIYFGDTARVPYGGRTPNEIIRFNREIISFLIAHGAKMVIMACGTSSAIAYPLLKDKYNVPLVSLIEPGAAAAAGATKNGKIGLIATQATVDSSAYQQALKKIDSKIKVFPAACPLFVPLVEGGFLEGDETQKTAVQYIKPLVKAGIDTLILGCTHYPHLIKVLRQAAGMAVKFVDPAEEAVSEASKRLASAGLLSRKQAVSGREKITYYVTGTAGKFQDMGSMLMNRPVKDVHRTVLSKTLRTE